MPCAHRNKGSEFLPPATDAKHAPARANGSRKTSRSELVYVGNPLTKRYINGSFLYMLGFPNKLGVWNGGVSPSIFLESSHVNLLVATVTVFDLKELVAVNGLRVVAVYVMFVMTQRAIGEIPRYNSSVPVLSPRSLLNAPKVPKVPPWTRSLQKIREIFHIFWSRFGDCWLRFA